MDETTLVNIKRAATNMQAQLTIILALLEGVVLPFPTSAQAFSSPTPVTHSYDALCERFGGPEKFAYAILERTIGTPTSAPIIQGSWNDRKEARDFYADHPELFTVNPFPEPVTNPDNIGA